MKTVFISLLLQLDFVNLRKICGISAPDLGVTKTLKERTTGFVKGKSEELLDQFAGQIAESVESKLHALIYRDSSVHVVNDDGKHIGYVEATAPKLVRNILKNQLGFDVEKSIPGLPSFVVTPIANYLENWGAQVLQEQVFDLVKKATKHATFMAVGKAMGIADARLETMAQQKGLNFKADHELEKVLTVDKSKCATALKQDLSKVTADKDEQQAYANMGAALYKNLAARLKISINSWIEDAKNEVAQRYSHQLIEKTGDASMRCVEVATGAAATTLAAAVSGGTGAVLVGAAFNADNYMAEGAQKKSYFRTFLENVFGYDQIVTQAKQQANRVVATNLNANKILGNLGPQISKLLVVTEEDRDAAYGKYTSFDLDDGSGFTELRQVEKPVDFTFLFEEAKSQIAKAKEKIVQAAQTAKQEIKHAAHAFADASDKFAKELNPMLSDDFWDDEPSQNAVKVAQSTESKKPFWKFW